MANTTTVVNANSPWEGGIQPFKASYGKLMMWFFLISDAFTFSTFLVVYGVIRFSTDMAWANPEEVFTHVPILTELFHAHPPLVFVGIMTFILIASSVTMVLAVEAGHRMDRETVKRYMIWTILGGVAFLSCQAYEWYNFIMGSEFGSVYFSDGTVGTVLSAVGDQLKIGGAEFSWAQAVADHGNPVDWVQGASLFGNQYSQNPSFSALFFFITGFHGSHVASGVMLNYIVYRQVSNGVMDRRGHYEMVEKVGLYWHFVDLVWVFVFTFFYLI